MIDAGYQHFFSAPAGASATLIGLLFVAVSVAPEQLVGERALGLHGMRSSMALAAFGSTLLLSLIALTPHARIGWPATIIGAIGVAYSVTTARDRSTVGSGAQRRRAVALLGGLR
jgi:hypothetical protein